MLTLTVLHDSFLADQLGASREAGRRQTPDGTLWASPQRGEVKSFAIV